MSKTMCFYCSGTYAIPNQKYCKGCEKELETNREAFLKRILASTEEEITAFIALSANPGQYRISKRSSGDEYAKARFGNALQIALEKKRFILSELKVDDR